ncbi:MAG: FAD-dependent oxidoreductase, partial [Chloroflexi bacterium]|nr:FAD-dependent oxidoreductase [Chloroflexota bacterium]
VGLANLNEKDVALAGDRLRPDGAGIGDYPMDSHAVRVKRDWNRPDMGEGEYWLYRYTPWYQIPIGVVIPADRDGLLVAEAVSATHVGYGTLRLEPVRMELGDLCGELAALEINSHLNPRTTPASIVQENLSADGQRIFWHADVTPGTAHSPAIEFMGAHGFWTGAAFGGSGPVTHREAALTLRALQLMEAEQSGLPVPARPPDVLRNPITPEAPLIRGEFAVWLVAAQGALRRDWIPPKPAEDEHGTYPDLSPGDPVGSAAEVLRRHYIGVESWQGTLFTAAGLPLYSPQAKMTRADYAEALFLAQRDFPAPFFKPAEITVPPVPDPPPPRAP